MHQQGIFGKILKTGLAQVRSTQWERASYLGSAERERKRERKRERGSAGRLASRQV
jgi:hypothetical protein